MTEPMKKILIVLILSSLLLVGCGPAPADVPDDTQPPESTAESTVPPQSTVPPLTTVPVPTTEAPVIPEIYPDTVGIYIPAADGTAARKRLTEFSAPRTAKTDIDCFEILASREDRLEGTSFAAIWNDAWGAHANTENAKIGFRIEFTLSSGERISTQLLKPSDSAAFYDYLEIYLYDDIHQTPGVWYTHLEDDDMNSETIISSIKLTSGSRIGEVGDIVLTAFIYNGDDCFDAEGNYLGPVLDSIIVTQ